jgi:hypothetical protein
MGMIMYCELVYFKVLFACLFIYVFILAFFLRRTDSHYKPNAATPTETHTRYLLHVRDIGTFVWKSCQ